MFLAVKTWDKNFSGQADDPFPLRAHMFFILIFPFMLLILIFHSDIKGPKKVLSIFFNYVITLSAIIGVIVFLNNTQINLMWRS